MSCICNNRSMAHSSNFQPTIPYASSLAKSSHTQQAEPFYVRPARPSDAHDIAQLQAKNMKHLLTKLLGAELSSAANASIDAAAFERQWEETIRARHPKSHVLLARAENRCVGFAAGIAQSMPEIEDIASGRGKSASEIEECEAAAEKSASYVITAFEIDYSSHIQREYAAPLLSAIADHARREHATSLYAWLFSGDDAAVSLFAEAGFAPEGTAQQFEIEGTLLVQHAWWAHL